MAGKLYDTNRKYMMHCKRCGYSFVWDMNPVYSEIRELHIEYQSILRIMEQIPENERKRTNERYMRLRSRRQQVAAELSDLKTIRIINEAASEKGRLEELKEVLRETYGETELERLLAVVDERMRPYTAKGLMKNYREE